MEEWAKCVVELSAFWYAFVVVLIHFTHVGIKSIYIHDLKSSVYLSYKPKILLPTQPIMAVYYRSCAYACLLPALQNGHEMLPCDYCSVIVSV